MKSAKATIHVQDGTPFVKNGTPFKKNGTGNFHNILIFLVPEYPTKSRIVPLFITEVFHFFLFLHPPLDKFKVKDSNILPDSKHRISKV